MVLCYGKEINNYYNLYYYSYFYRIFIVLSIDQFRAVKASKTESNEKETNLLIQYKDSVETDDEAIESRESEKDSKSYLLPNAVKNQYIKVSPL